MIGRRLVMVAVLCVLAAGANGPGVRHLTGGFPLEQKTLAQAPPGMVYVGSNIGHETGKNSILAFQRDSEGKLTALGEYLTGGTGVHPVEATPEDLPTKLGPFDSDQCIILNRAGNRLFAVNSGSDTIAVFDIKTDGSLVAVPGSPFPSGGVNPVSLGLASTGPKLFEPPADSDVLTVVNKDYDLTRPGFDPTRRAPNYTTFRVSPQGRLVRIPNSTIVAAQGGSHGLGNSIPSQALVSPTGRLVFDTDFFGFKLHSFFLQPDGRLRRVSSQTMPASEFIEHPLISRPQGLVIPLGLQVHPQEPVFYAGMVFEGRMGVFSYSNVGLYQGNFRFVRSVEAGAGICWIVINASGNRIYTSNTIANTISVLDSSDPLNPVKIQDFALSGPAAGALQLALDSRGEFLYVITQKTLNIFPEDANALHALKIGANGQIAEQTDRVVLSVAPSFAQGVIAR